MAPHESLWSRTRRALRQWTRDDPARLDPDGRRSPRCGARRTCSSRSRSTTASSTRSSSSPARCSARSSSRRSRSAAARSRRGPPAPRLARRSSRSSRSSCRSCSSPSASTTSPRRWPASSSPARRSSRRSSPSFAVQGRAPAAASGIVGIVDRDRRHRAAVRRRPRRRRATRSSAALGILLAGLGYAVGALARQAQARTTSRRSASPASIIGAQRARPAARPRPFDAPDRGARASAPSRAMLALGAGGTGIAFLIFYTLNAEIGPSRASIVAYIAPVFSVLYGVTLLDEHVHRRHRRRPRAHPRRLVAGGRRAPAAPAPSGLRRRLADTAGIDAPDPRRRRTPRRRAGRTASPRSGAARRSAAVGGMRGEVGAVGDHRVERVAHRDDPRAERDLRRRQPVGVAGAVPALVAWSGRAARRGRARARRRGCARR